MSWATRPTGMEAPGHDYRGGEMEEVLDQIERLSSLPLSAQSLDAVSTQGTTTSVPFTNTLTTTGIRGVAFTAGDSGKVMVAGSSHALNNVATGYAFMDFEVRDGNVIGSGGVIRAADELSCAVGQSDPASSAFCLAIPSTLVTGLVPGAQYNVALTYHTLANTATYNRRKISVQYTI